MLAKLSGRGRSPGPAHDLPNAPDDSAFAVPNIVPELSEGAPPFSPVFRYPWKDARNAVRAAPTWKDGTRRVRYINPITGGSTMPLMDCYLAQIDKGTETVPLIHAVEDWGREQGCDECIGYGRWGWKRAMEKEGYEMNMVAFRKTL